MIRNIFVFAVLFVFISCDEGSKSALPFFNSAEFDPEWIADKSAAYSRVHTIDQFVFTDQNGRKISNKDFDGKIYVADFFFTTCPSICPKMTSHMKVIQDHFLEEDRVKLISHTVVPWVDTVAQLKRYAIEKGVDDEKWHLITGTEESIYGLARNSYFAEKEIGLQKTTDDFLHTENFLLIDTHRRIRGIYNGTILKDVKRLIEDMETLLAELALSDSK